jgi:hypothetical protein
LPERNLYIDFKKEILMKIYLSIAVLAFFAISISVISDILPDGKKKISFSFELTNTDSFSDYVFLAYPVNTSPGAPYIECLQVTAGKPVYLPCKYGPSPRIYAINKDFYNADDYKHENNTQMMDSLFVNNKNLIPSLNISCYGYADKNAPFNSVLESYKIISVSKDTMIINHEKTLKKDGYNNIIDESKGDLVDTPGSRSITRYIYYALPLIAAIFIVSLILIRRMKK